MSFERTPILDLDGILAKLECVHTCGSIKDRIADYILSKSEELGLLKPGMRIVEATSGNTGIAMAYYGRKRGYAVTIVMPEHMTEERKAVIRSLGAELILCSESGGFAEAAKIRDELAQQPGMFNPDQFGNPLNVECHRLTTGKELIEDAGRKIDAFVAGVGTGGTLIGIGEALREVNPEVHLAAVEPAEAAVMSGGQNSSHAIFGIGDGFIPQIASNGEGGLHPLIDEVIVVRSADAIAAAHQIREKHGLCVGISSGANFLAAQRLRERFETVATIFADGYIKYESYGLSSAEAECPFRDRCTAQNLRDLASTPDA